MTPSLAFQETGKTRNRTARQLERKRMCDKESQKAKRERVKTDIKELQSELHDAREEVIHLRGVIKAMRSHLAPVESHDRRPAHPSNNHDHPGYKASEVSTASHLRTLPGPEQRCRLPPILGCRCEPKKHESFSECVEWTIYTGITKMRHHQTATPPIPLTPEVANLLFLREPEHEVAKTLMKLLKRPNQENLVIRCAVYVLAYRILRYRYFPSLETYNDIPDWLRPTPIQYNTPHPLYIDLVPFPRFRHALTLGVVNVDCIRDQFDADFGRHISVNWPFSNSLFVVNDYFNTVLNPEFERHVCAEENWSLDLEFARKYPTIAPLVTIRDDFVL
ncbi:hypothetical protein BKA64DRAFT_626751 [Cadophora sp. MPI-SDFR-AT-0126]|nr:hypothetical protein BKA64DRAFT_626751 [Leotiomycetes sp. MPI-SDFR-AT-0126]